MRLLHTADWHLGRPFHGESLLSAQAAFVDWLVEAARSERAEAILVAGDLYDRALPPVDAVRLADEALERLSDVCPVVVISGNHDSAARLSFGARLLARAGLHLRTDVLRCGEPVLAGDVAIYPVPYLEPDVVRASLGAERSHAAVLDAAMGLIRADRAQRPAGTRTVVMAHAFVGGGVPSDSERDLAVGGVASVGPATFAGADYVALGHLHQPQQVGSSARYAGSPLALSFSEAGQRKSVALVDLGAGEPVVEALDTPVPRALARLRGTLEGLLRDESLRRHESAWLQVTLTDPARPQDAMQRLRRRYPHTLELLFEPEGALDAGEGGLSARLRGLDDEALLAGFVAEARGTAPADAELELLRDALAAHRVDQVAA